jgi:carbamoyl-phosphate synthase large subunit
MRRVPYYTTLAAAETVAEAIAASTAGSLEMRPLQEYF